MKPHERLQYIEEKLLDPNQVLRRISPDDTQTYEEVYGCSERTFERTLTEYNRNLNLLYNLEYDVEDPSTSIKYVECINGIYRLKKDPQGNPYVLFNQLSSLKEKDWKRLVDLIEFNSDLFDESFINKFKGYKVYWNAQDGADLVPWKPVQLIKNGHKSGKVNLEVLAKAIAEKRFIEVDHKSLAKGKGWKTVKLLPLLLKEYGNGWISGWYLLAYVVPQEGIASWPKLNQLNVYALDRLKNVQLLRSTFNQEIPENYSPDDYFKYTLGVHRVNRNNPELAPERVVIRTTVKDTPIDYMWIYPYLLNYPIHETQRIISDNPETKELTIELQMEIDIEFKAFLMKYATDLEVLEPLSLRTEIKEKLKQALQSYAE